MLLMMRLDLLLIAGGEQLISVQPIDDRQKIFRSKKILLQKVVGPCCCLEKSFFSVQIGEQEILRAADTEKLLTDWILNNEERLRAPVQQGEAQITSQPEFLGNIRHALFFGF